MGRDLQPAARFSSRSRLLFHPTDGGKVPIPMRIPAATPRRRNERGMTRTDGHTVRRTFIMSSICRTHLSNFSHLGAPPAMPAQGIRRRTENGMAASVRPKDNFQFRQNHKFGKKAISSEMATNLAKGRTKRYPFSLKF